jgi:DNA modification methylase
MVLEKGNRLVPIEIKWTENPRESDFTGLAAFRAQEKSKAGYLLCRIPRSGAGYTFNYHQKSLVQRSFDLRDETLLDDVLRARGVTPAIATRLRAAFKPIDEDHTIEHLRGECADPSKLRREKGERDIAAEIVKAQFAAFMWCSLDEREMHAHFDPLFSEAAYRASFWDQIHLRTPHLFSRDHALHVLRVPPETFSEGYAAVRRMVAARVQAVFSAMNNHGFLAVVIERSPDGGAHWTLAGDVTLFAEKHREVALDKGYFRPDRVRRETLAHVPGVEESRARFEIASEGFTYRDCFVLADKTGAVQRLALIFQKNERDETPVPCPTCRSADVQGNSYSSLGVRSWECNNPLCPDRSKYNRGKRYSFRSMVMQQAIDDEANEIPVESVRRWSRDVVLDVSDDELLDMLLRHYSMHGDTVHVSGWNAGHGSTVLGRRVVPADVDQSAAESVDGFWSSALFARFAFVGVPARAATAAPVPNLGTADFQVLNGDAAVALGAIDSNTFDGAITSPPYYNARDYAQWPNIYCHLHDMMRIGAEVLRTLKPGALFVYNVFDYFDNENTVVFSDMGKKRIPLSAYTIDIFRRVGFECLGNIVWDKGEIEGKRGFNAGNFSPYYQAPFNCWEHVLVFAKPGRRGDALAADRVLRAQPVVKMIRGENVHGHTAPFPDALPELLIRALKPGAVVLDPFGGSLTTGRVAARHGLRAVCIERSEDYCRLGLRMHDSEERNGARRRDRNRCGPQQ